ncbi:hypothetical protein V6N13_074115 [Hibiscus sabdariffa]|uniref:Aminotransferase-like plant mobile domain-containing protein n=1 Tax=Hibiscus sabdariffa TaxID=183260 RepID=A0ABR2U853_9ROSI
MIGLWAYSNNYHACRQRGRAFVVPANEVLQGYLDFDNEDAMHFRSIRHRRFQVFKYIPDHTLDSLHLRDAFMHYFDAIDFDADLAYATLTNLPNATYNAKNTKGWNIHDPTLRYIHRFLAYNYSEMNDTSAILSKVELFFLWCMHTGRKVNLGFWFARAFEYVVQTDRPLILGPYITRLTSRLFPLTFNTNEFTFAFTMDPLDARCLDSMGLLAGTPSAPHLVPPGTIMPRDGCVFLQRATQPAAPLAMHPPLAMQDEMHNINDRLHSIEANISEILSYLCPGSSQRGRGRGCH